MCLTDLANPQYLDGERTGIRTPDTRLRRALLYPAELCTHIFIKVERVKGIEPSQPAWKAGTLPLSYTRIIYFGGGWWIRTTESIANRFTVCPLWPLGKSSVFGAGNRTRTYNLLITSQLLYQLSHTSILLRNIIGDLEGARTLDLQRDRLAF